MKDKDLKPFDIPLDGKLITEPDPADIGKNFRDLQNLRYTALAKKGVAGMTKINTSALSYTP